jgi:hypothetical protein
MFKKKQLAENKGMVTAVHKKGYMLFIVLSTLIIVSLFASILMAIILSQGRLTKHVTSRIQAYYAARGALNYANDRLRVNDANWVSPSAVVTVNFCRAAGASCPSPNIIDPEIPASIRSLTVQVFPPGSGIPAGSPTSRRIKITADYAYIIP